jgi:hypothetical protein
MGFATAEPNDHRGVERAIVLADEVVS